MTFRYPSAEREILRDVSFHIRPGEYVAFVGPSGAGKSTLYRLLLGFERPTAGSVLLDGHDLLSLDLSAMRRQMGVVLQNGQVIPGTILMNIVGEAALTEREAWEAARAAGLDKDIEALPMRMNTILAEGGAGLSGGQKQRLLVARALARKPRVLLFDEATSMLDNRTQDTIRSTLHGLTATRVLIAHRLSTVVDVDRIYVMPERQDRRERAIWGSDGAGRPAGGDGPPADRLNPGSPANVQVDVEVEDRAEASEEGDGSGAGASA